MRTESNLPTEPKRAKRVSVFLPDLKVGGAQRVTVNLAKAFSHSGLEVELVVADHRGRFVDEIEGVIEIVELRNHFQSLGVLGVVLSLRRYLIKRDPDVLVSSLSRANVAAILANKLAGKNVRLIGIEHLNVTDKVDNAREKITFLLAKALYPHLDEVVAVSNGVARSISNVFDLDKDTITVVPNIVITDEFKERANSPADHRWIDDDRDLIVSLGRLSEQKDYPNLLEAFSRIESDDARLLVIGKGELEGDLERLAKELGIGDRVEFTGYVENPYAYISNASLFVLSSKREGLPTVLIEALGCGCPIVSTDCPSGPEEVLDFGRYGRLEPVGDPDRLAGAIDAELSKEHDETVLLRRADHYSAETVVPLFEKLM